MPATVSNVDTTSSLGSGSTVVATGVTANVGDWLVVAVSADNNGTSGAASLTTTLTESAGNTATNQGGIITASAAGVALDGISLGIWTVEVTAAITSGTITANFSPNTAAKMIAVQRVEPGAGETISLIAVGAGDTGQAAQASITAPSVESGDIVFGCCAIESNTMGTADSDTTNGSWSTQYGVAGTNTSALAGAAVQMQYKTVSATGDQTYNVGNVATDRQWAINYIVLRSASSGSLSIAGTATGSSSASAALVERNQIVAQCDAAGSGTAQLSERATLLATVAATGLAQAALGQRLAISAVAGGNSSAVLSLSIQGGSLSISGVAVASGGASISLTSREALAASAVGVGLLSGSLWALERLGGIAAASGIAYGALSIQGVVIGGVLKGVINITPLYAGKITVH